MKGTGMETKGKTCLALLFVAASVVGAVNPASKPAPKTFDELVKILQTGNAYQRVEVVSRLARIDDVRVVPILIGLLEDPNDRVRGYTAQQLSYLADERAADALAEALSDSARNVRRYAGEGLIKIGSERHVPALVASVVSHLPGTTGDGYESTYSAPALEAIAKLSSQAPAQIVGLLGRVSDEAVTEHEDWWRFLTNVATWLGQIGDRAALDAPIGAIAWALGNIADPRAIPALEAMSNRYRLSDGDRLWIAAALVRLGHDYEANAALIRTGLPQTIRYAAWLNDGETVAALAKLVPSRDRGDTYIIDTLVAMGTAEALDALMSLADAETDPLRFQYLCKAAGDLGERLKHPEGQRYRAQAKVAVAVRGLFAMAQRAQPAEVSRRNHDLIDKYPQLARRIWIIEATRRLNLALRSDHKPWECVIPHRALRFADRAFDPEMIPALKRFIAEDTQTVSHHGKDGVVPHYHYRSLAAAILAEKTGKQVTFVDIDGRAHPGGWRPPSAIDPGDASIQQ